LASRFVRLNHQQWENSVRDVLKLPAPLGLSTSFVAEPLRSTFDTNGSLLSVSPDLWQDYQTAAETVGNKVARDPALLASVAPAMPPDAAGRAKAFIEKIGARAFRRPLTDAEKTRYATSFDKGATLIGSGDAFADGVEVVLAAFFQSASFLYRVEVSTAVVGAVVPLNDYEVASRISYGLTNTIPDDALFAAAAAKKLATRDGVIEHAKRLLATPAAESAVASFHDQLFRMREYDAIKKDEKLFPYFPVGIGADLKMEALTFVKDVVFTQDRGLVELLTAPYTFANTRVAQVYGITAPGAQPTTFVRVALDPSQRAGLLTQAGFLAANGEQQTPNIIMRGVHIAKDVLCVDVPPPPDAVPPLPAIPPMSTNRQRVENLTKDAPCSGCHATMINPLGFAFENLDGVGRFRTQENGQTINTSSTYTLDGMPMNYSGAIPLIQAIATSKQAHDCYARHWVEYLYGRDVDASNAADLDLVTQAGALSKGSNSVKNLIVNLVATDAFLTRLP
jgi:hypothetical protein